jgi:uncharacterized Tic20 family protein
MQPSAETTEGAGTAIAAQSLYLVNLLVAPVLGFLLLLGLWWRRRENAPPLAAAHLAQTISGSIWAGFLLVVANLLIVILGGYDGPWVWTIVITYFTVCHSVLVVFGALGLARAMAGQCWRYPLVGRPLPPGCAAGGAA